MRPISIMIKPVSGACNMRCRYCFYTDVMDHRQTRVYPRMTIDTLEVIVRRAFRYADGPVNISFQGGEPTLIGLPFFEALMRFEREYNTRALPVVNAVQTNGFDLSDEMIEFFARENFLLGVSLDGTAEIHDSMRVDAQGRPTFRRICATLDRLAAAKVQFNILCVVNEYVARRPQEVFSELARFGFLQFIPCLDGFDGETGPHSLTEASYLHFLKVSFDLYCDAFFSGAPVSIRNFDNFIGMILGRPPENCAMGGKCGDYFLIESDGSVYPCDFYVLDEWRLGNILDAPFNRLGQSPLRRQFRDASLPVPDSCRACKWYFLCRNGCKRERHAGRNRWCACMRDFFEYSYPRMVKIAQQIQKRDQL